MVRNFLSKRVADVFEPEAIANEIELPTAIARLKADADAALDAGRPVTAHRILDEVRELEIRRQRLQKVILASRDRVPSQVDDLEAGTTG